MKTEDPNTQLEQTVEQIRLKELERRVKELERKVRELERDSVNNPPSR